MDKTKRRLQTYVDVKLIQLMWSNKNSFKWNNNYKLQWQHLKKAF